VKAGISLEDVAVASATSVGTAATVRSNSGVVVNVIRSPPNASEALGKGSVSTEVAPGKARRSDAGADGEKEARSKSLGLSTLKRLN
jgi:hypothetical protein